MKAQVSNGITFTDSDVINIDDYDPEPGGNIPFLLHDHGFTLCVVFAVDLQDALDIAADEGALDRYKIEDFEKGDYEKEDWDNGRISFLGNHCRPFDIETLGVLELSNPPFSFAALYSAAAQKGFQGKKS